MSNIYTYDNTIHVMDNIEEAKKHITEGNKIHIKDVCTITSIEEMDKIVNCIEDYAKHKLGRPTRENSIKSKTLLNDINILLNISMMHKEGHPEEYIKANIVACDTIITEGLKVLKSKGKLINKDIADILGVSEKTIQRYRKLL